MLITRTQERHHHDLQVGFGISSAAVDIAPNYETKVRN